MTNPTQATFVVVEIADGHETRTSFPSLAEAREYVEANGLTNNRTDAVADRTRTDRRHDPTPSPLRAAPNRHANEEAPSRWKSRKQREQERQQQARPFRVQAFAELARQADLLRVIIVTDTRVEKLKDAYLEDMPGLHFERTSQDKQEDTVYHLIRQPQPTSDNRNANTSGRTRAHE